MNQPNREFTHSPEYKPHEFQHTFLPHLSERLQESINKIIGIQRRVILIPRIGSNDSADSEKFYAGAAGTQTTEAIFVFPQLIGLFFEYYNHLDDAERLPFIEHLLQKVEEFQRQHQSEIQMVPEVKVKLDTTIANLKECTEQIKKSLKVRFPVKLLTVWKYLKTLSFVENQGNQKEIYTSYFNTLWSFTQSELLSKNPEQVEKILFEETEAIAIHESIHSWIKNLVPEYRLSEKEYEENIKPIRSKVDALEEKFKDKKNIPYEKDMGLKRHRKRSLKRTKEIIKLVNEEIREKYLFTFLWYGVEENIVRATTHFLTGKADYYQKDDIQAYSNVRHAVVYGGNEEILKIEKILNQSGLQGLNAYIEEEKKRIKQMSKKILWEVKIKSFFSR